MNKLLNGVGLLLAALFVLVAFAFWAQMLLNARGSPEFLKAADSTFFCWGFALSALSLCDFWSKVRRPKARLFIVGLFASVVFILGGVVSKGALGYSELSMLALAVGVLGAVRALLVPANWY